MKPVLTKMMAAILLTAGLSAAPVLAQDAQDPFADAVEARHGLMLLLAGNVGTLGAMAKGTAPYDAAVADRAASNIVALSSVLSPDLFPEGSAYGAAADSYALPAIWTNGDDFLAKIADMNAAAAAMQTAAAGGAESLQGGMAALGGACSACHKAYRQPEE